MRIIKSAVMTGLLLLASSAGAQTIYKSVDENGAISYTDRPPYLSETEQVVQTESTGMRVKRTDNAAVAERAAQQQLSYVERSRQRQDLETGQTVQREESSKVAAERQENCQQARAKQEKYSTARRLYREDADGERDYLNDDELTKARVDARNAVDDWCGG